MTAIHLKVGKVGEISLKENTNLGRGENIDRLLPPLLDHPLQTHKRSKRSKRSKQSHKRKRKWSMLSSSSYSSNHSVNDYGRYKRTRQSPQVAEVPTTLQSVGTINESPILQSDNVAQHSAKDTSSESEQEIWSFDRAINEVFRLLPQELCPKPTKEQTPAKPLLGIENLMVTCDMSQQAANLQTLGPIVVAQKVVVGGEGRGLRKIEPLMLKEDWQPSKPTVRLLR